MKINPFAQTLKEYRGQYRISQNKLGKAAGFDHSYISRLEQGKRLPSKEAVARISEALKLDETGRDRLLASAGFLPTDPDTLILYPEIRMLNAALGVCPPHVREDALASIRIALRGIAAEATG